MFVFGSIGLIFGAAIIYYLSLGLPDVQKISTYIPSETTKIYSADNVLLAELHREENRILIPLDKISPALKDGVIAMEDTDFYSHNGLNFRGIMRALYKDIKAMSFVEGGSTLTQQLARNLFLHRRKKLIRKLEEAILAVQIEKYFTKDEILEMYLNQVYWGHNAYGIESASRLYFGKNSSDLKLGEAALLVGLLQGPELFTPFRNYGRAKQRQLIVLNRMLKTGKITEQERIDAYREDLKLANRKKFKYKAPFFTSHIVKQLIEMYGEEEVYTAGLKVQTTLDYSLQQHAEELVKKYVDKGNKSHWIKGKKVPSLNYTQAAILAMDPTTGFVKVMQGGVDFKSNEFNRTTQSKRQPGSAFKPFVYLSALEKGFSPGSIIDDTPVTFNTIEGPYSPQNYNKKFLGPMPMRKALEKSVNVVAIKLNELVGPDYVIDVAKRLGIESNLKPILSLPLGAMEVSMMELVGSYGVLANNGRRVKPVSILEIRDREGVVLYESKIQEQKVAESHHIAALVEMMRGVVKYGTGRNANLPRPVAGKTGTTTDYKDAWFVGFVPQLVTGVWVGNDNNQPMENITGGWIPALMWKDFMIKAMDGITRIDFPRPRLMVQRKINWLNGRLATDASPEEFVTLEKFWQGKEPIMEDNSSQSSHQQKTEENQSGNLLDFFR